MGTANPSQEVCGIPVQRPSLGGSQAPLEQAQSLLVGETRQRLLSGQPAVPNHRLGADHRLGFAEVKRNLGCMRLCLLSVELLQRPADLRVQPCPAGRRQLFCQGLL